MFTIVSKYKDLNAILSLDETNIPSFLREKQDLSDAMIDRFFAPFYQGIFLSPLELQSSRMFNFVFKMFVEGSATLPARGMQAVPQQLADALPADTLQLNTKYTTIDS